MITGLLMYGNRSMVKKWRRMRQRQPGREAVGIAPAPAAAPLRSAEP
jgi:hypothetical protein